MFVGLFVPWTTWKKWEGEKLEVILEMFKSLF